MVLLYWSLVQIFFSGCVCVCEMHIQIFIVYLNLIMCEMSENLDKCEVSVCSLLSAGYVALCAYLVWSQVWICRYAAYCNLHFSIVCFLLLSGGDPLKMSSVSLKRLKCYWSHSLYIFCMLIMEIQTCVIEMFQIIQDIWCFKKKKAHSWPIHIPLKEYFIHRLTVSISVTHRVLPLPSWRRLLFFSHATRVNRELKKNILHNLK